MHNGLIKVILLSTFALFFLIKNVGAQNSGLSLEEYAIQRMQEHNVVGASIGTIKNGRLESILYLGFESETSKIPVNKKSLFQVGSISKPVAAWAAMTLVRDRKLDLDQPVQRYIKQWSIPASKFSTEQVTLRRLLSHTAGFRLGGYGGFPEGQALPTLVESLSGKTNGSGSVELFQEPAKGFSYSGGGYTIIQLLIEEVSGIPFSDYVQLAVLGPLQMVESSYQPKAELLERRIQPHSAFRKPIAQHDFRAQAAASLHTTVSDLGRFIIANLMETSVLDSDAIAMMHTPIADAGFADVGLGFFVSADGKLIGHGGANFGWRAEIQFSTESRDGLIVMTNSEGADQFLFDVKCDWDMRRQEPLLSKPCNERKSKIALAKIIVLFIASLMTIAISVLLWALLTSRVQLSLPRTKEKFVTLSLLVGVTLFFVLFMYTPLGVYLMAGFKSISATIHYAPPFIAILIPWVCGILLFTWFPFFIKKRKVKET